MSKNTETIELEMINNIIKEATLNLCKDINCNCKYSKIHTSVLKCLEEVDKRLAQINGTNDDDTLLLDQIVTNLIKLNREYYDFLMKKLALPSKGDVIDESKLMPFNQIQLQINNKISALKNDFQIEEIIEPEDNTNLTNFSQENNGNKEIDNLTEKFDKILKYFFDLLYGNNLEIKSLTEFKPLYYIFKLDLQHGLENMTSEEIQESNIFNIFDAIKYTYFAIMQALEKKKKSCNNIWNFKKDTDYLVYCSFQRELKKAMDYINDTIAELQIKLKTEGIEDSNIELPDSPKKYNNSDDNYFSEMFYNIGESNLHF